MTDPYAALTSFQQALSQGEIAVQPGALNPDVFVHADQPNGEMRLTYVQVDGGTVIAFATFVGCDPVEGRPCFQIGYAVPDTRRNQGLATSLVKAAIAEMQHGFTRARLTPFFIEAIVGVDNLASQHVAAKTLSADRVEVTDRQSGQPAYQYLRKIE
ncbi:GNAT family protein [Frateuria sp. Soil773]|uniref:GNAT family N-acetyltransferase n=1 Tax=Frateuria sp. Soil773 TaxID=1736407 RepID=UPI001F25FB44|nr:GNAT family protein [Frateuria sp. Soil773]